jgi:hypothetical protein
MSGGPSCSSSASGLWSPPSSRSADSGSNVISFSSTQSSCSVDSSATLPVSAEKIAIVIA